MANVVITGAAGGIGEVTVRKLINDGHTVVGLARDIAGRNAAKAAELEKLGAKFFECDITSEASVHRGIDGAMSHMKDIDVLINNAAVAAVGPIEVFSVVELMEVFNVNIFGTHRVSRAVSPILRKKQKGLIINISSLLGRMSVPFYGAYCTSKWALEGLTESYRMELSQLGVEVCLIEPGGFHTEIYAKMTRPKDKERLKSYGPLGDAVEMVHGGIVKTLFDNPELTPNKVAQTIADVISTPHGQRPLRTVIDFTGMGGPIAQYNQTLGDITKGVFESFGMSAFLTVAVKS